MVIYSRSSFDPYYRLLHRRRGLQVDNRNTSCRACAPPSTLTISTSPYQTDCAVLAEERGGTMEKPNNQTLTLVVLANIIHVGGAGSLGNCVSRCPREDISPRKVRCFSPVETTPEEVRCNAKNPHTGCMRLRGLHPCLAKETIRGLNRHPNPSRWNTSHYPA